MVTTSTSAEQRVMLQNISWQLFENLLAEMGENRSTRLTYYLKSLRVPPFSGGVSGADKNETFFGELRLPRERPLSW